MKSYFENFKDLKIIFVFKGYDNVKNVMLKWCMYNLLKL